MGQSLRDGVVSALMVLWIASPVLAQNATDAAEAVGFEVTPPRLSLADGQVSFLRAGAEQWSPARVNTPLAFGDEVYSGSGSNFEIQVGGRAYVRGAADAQLGLTTLEPDYLQFRVTTGQVSLDLRSLTKGQSFEFSTPNASFIVERTGYYRVVVDGDTTTLTTRRGGSAILTLASGDTKTVAASEQAVVSGANPVRVETYAAPELDAWDRWNYTRTDVQVDAVSARYVPADVYGTTDLDHYGDWRVVANYGPIWVPRDVPLGWSPYTTGRWIYDPVYSWSWVDDFDWGWAPYHYGRWVSVSGRWGWAPGPLVARARYSPALVAFFGDGGVSVRVSIGLPDIGWVALGWGEPLLPWWGPASYRARPHWAGWGGPRFVNNVEVRRGSVIDARKIQTYRNVSAHDSIVWVARDHFGRGEDISKLRSSVGKNQKFELLRGDPGIKPARSSLTTGSGAARRPPKEILEREVVARRAPRAPDVSRFGAREARSSTTPDWTRGTPPTRVVPKASQRPVQSGTAVRPPFAKQGGGERGAGPPAPRLRDINERSQAGRISSTPTPPRDDRALRASGAERPARQTREGTQPAATPRVRESQPTRTLPGEPANRVYRSSRESRAGSGSPAAAPGRTKSQPQQRQKKAGRDKQPK